MPAVGNRAMRALALLLRLAVAVAEPTTQLLFNFTQVRYPWATSIQLSELVLYDAAGYVVGAIDTSNPGGVPPYSTQLAQQATDGTVSTKWVDIGFSENGFSLLYVTPTAGSTVASCAQTQPYFFIPTARIGLCARPGLSSRAAARAFTSRSRIRPYSGLSPRCRPRAIFCARDSPPADFSPVSIARAQTSSSPATTMNGVTR